MLSFQYPAAFILLCLLLGAVYALALYFRHSFIKDPTPGQQRLMYFLGALRFIVIALIAMLLLSPYIKSRFTEIQKPVILILQDNSESVKNIFSNEDSARYASDVRQLSEKLRSAFDVKEYAFDDALHSDIPFSFTGKLTNISDNLNDLINLYGGQNVGAVVLATDGIYNKGANPLYVSANLKFPVYTVAMGDTTPRRDLKVSKILYNQIVYMGNRFKIRVDAEADNLPEAKTFIDIFDMSERGNPKKLDTREVAFTASKKFLSEEFVLEAKKAGVQRYQAALRPVEGEFTKANNYLDFFVEALDSRQKILLVAHAPHPDIAAIRQANESNKNYEITVKFADEMPSLKPDDYNLVILHQLPSQRHPATKLTDIIRDKKISSLFIIGAQSNLQGFNNVSSALQINASGQGMNDATPVVHENFPLFTLSDELKRQLPEFPPLKTPFGDFAAAAAAKKLLAQKIGSVKTEYPALLFHDALGHKTAVLCGEGVWRWKLYDYRLNKNYDVFNELVSKTVQYLSVKEDRRQFRVRMAKNVFYENELISFTAELYNDSYELVNEPDASITLTDEDGKEFPFTFNKTSNAYALDAGNFPGGSYSFRARVKTGGKELTYDGKFTIVPMQLEAFSTVANHQLLYQVSAQSGGALFYPDAISTLGDTLLSNNRMKPLMYSAYKTESLINFWWLLLVFAGILSAEWFIRKYEGGY